MSGNVAASQSPNCVELGPPLSDSIRASPLLLCQKPIVAVTLSPIAAPDWGRSPKL
jgi:hypothetical protein